MRVADYIAQYLQQQGVSEIFMLSGTGSIHLDDAFANCRGMRYYCARHEAAAVMMAEASAKLNNRIGVVVATTGPGGMNALSGLVECWVDSTPVLVVSGQVESRWISPGVRSFGVQGFDITSTARPITKYCARVDDPRRIRYHLERALYESHSGRPGPVWLDVPTDIQAQEIEPDALEGFEPPSMPETPPADYTDLLRQLGAAARPLLVIGQGVRQAGMVSQIKALAERLGMPVVTSRLGQDLLPASHPLYFGLGGIKGRPEAAAIMRRCDFVLAIGSSLAHSFSAGFFERGDGQVPVAMVDIDPAEIRKGPLEVRFPLVMDLTAFMDGFSAALNQKPLPDWSAWLTECKHLRREHAVDYGSHVGNPINSYYFLQQLEQKTDRRHIFVSDAGGCYYITGQVLGFDNGQRELTSGAFASMGVALPLAIGAAASEPQAEIIVIVGDGSIELNIQELKTASQYRLNIKLFVINNGGYASIRDSQDASCGGRYTESGEILKFSNVAVGFVLPFYLIDDYARIGEDVDAILARPGPMLVEVVCDSHQQMLSCQ